MNMVAFHIGHRAIALVFDFLAIEQAYIVADTISRDECGVMRSGAAVKYVFTYKVFWLDCCSTVNECLILSADKCESTNNFPIPSPFEVGDPSNFKPMDALRSATGYVNQSRPFLFLGGCIFSIFSMTRKLEIF